ncbi:MAG: hypothetical protein V3V04_03345 [Rhizobiaceae bacterium]
MLYHLDVKTTTYPERNTNRFDNAKELLRQANVKEINILQVGPGMALKGVGRLNNLGKLRLIKRLETGLRRLPLPVSFYETYEPHEVISTFSEFLASITVADISQKSLDVVERTVSHKNLTVTQLDLTSKNSDDFEHLKNKFDLIICVNTIIRTGSQANRTIARQNLHSFAKDKSMIISESDFSEFGFEMSQHNWIWTRKF